MRPGHLQAEVWLAPLEVGTLIAWMDTGNVLLAWPGQEDTSGPAIRYDVISGELPPAGWSRSDPYGTARCEAAAVAGPMPGVGLSVAASRWFLVRAFFPGDACAPGTFGSSSGPADERAQLDGVDWCP